MHDLQIKCKPGKEQRASGTSERQTNAEEGSCRQHDPDLSVCSAECSEAPDGLIGTAADPAPYEKRHSGVKYLVKCLNDVLN